jgi:hypothetical protein
VYIHLFSCFSLFLAIFQVLQCEILIFLVCLFFRHITGPTVWVSHFSRFLCFLAIFQVLPCWFLIFLVCQFSQHIPEITGHVSHVTCFSGFSPYPGPSVFISHYSSFWLILKIFQVLQWFSFSMFSSVSWHIPVLTMWVYHFRFSVFSPYVMSYSVPLSFFSFFSFSRHIPVPTLCIFIFHIFDCFFFHIPCPTVCKVFEFSRRNPDPTFLIFQVFQCF